jgi:hypothetical protein
MTEGVKINDPQITHLQINDQNPRPDRTLIVPQSRHHTCQTDVNNL